MGHELEDGPPAGPASATMAVIRCAATTVGMLVRHDIHLGRRHLGTRIRFGDGTTGRVYRETVVGAARGPTPCVLVVAFRLRGVRGWGHRAFEVESILNTPLFVGFAGFVSKLWLAADERDVYRGLYEWDDPGRADRYARCLWRVLALVSEPGSIHYRVLPGLRPDDLLRDPHVVERLAPGRSTAWWRVVGVARRSPW